MFRDEFTKMVEFSLLKPEPLIKLFKPDFDILTYVKGKKIMVVNEDQEASILKDLKVYMFLIVAFVFMIIVISIFRLVKSLRVKMEVKLNNLKKQMMWNGLIQSIDITYIELLLTVST